MLAVTNAKARHVNDARSHLNYNEGIDAEFGYAARDFERALLRELNWSTPSCDVGALACIRHCTCQEKSRLKNRFSFVYSNGDFP
jgi:hypothetical protein